MIVQMWQNYSKNNIFLKNNIYDFCKSYFFSKILFFKLRYLKKIFASPFKKFNSAKKNLLCEKIHSVKQTHSVKDYFQFSFATNEQV